MEMKEPRMQLWPASHRFERFKSFEGLVVWKDLKDQPDSQDDDPMALPWSEGPISFVVYKHQNIGHSKSSQSIFQITVAAFA